MLSARNGYGQTPRGFPIVFDAFEPLMPEHRVNGIDHNFVS